MIVAERDGLGTLFTCSSSDLLGAAVRIVSSNTVTTADASSIDRSLVIGFISYKPTPTTCYIASNYYYSAASGFSGFSGNYSIGQPVYLTNNSGFSGTPGSFSKIVGESISPREALLRADPYTATSPVSRFRNKIINGAMNFYQRGSIAVTGYSLDRFYYENVTGSVATITQSTDVPTFSQSGENFQYSMRIDITTADTGVTGGEALDVIYKVEGYDWQDCHLKPLVVSFWVKSTKVGLYTFTVSNSANDRNYVTEYRVNTSNAWEFKVIRIPPCDNGGTWLFTNGVGANLRWFVASGPNYYATNNHVWNSTSLQLASANQVNGCDSTSNDFFLTGVQLEVGNVVTPFEWRPFSQELALCQRYYEKSYDIATAPANGLLNTEIGVAAVISDGLSMYCQYHTFAVTKRTSPTMTYYSPSVGGSAGQWTFYIGAWTAGNATTVTNDQHGFQAAVAGTTTAYRAVPILGDWAANSEL